MNAATTSALTITGQRVVLRRFDATDVTPTYLAWLNDLVVTRFSNQRFVRHDRDSCLRYLASFQGTQNLFLAIVRQDSGAMIGTMTAYRALPHGTADLGIMVGDRTVWGHGYGQDAWNALLEWMLRQDCVRKVTAGTLACNAAMLRLAERSGMHLEGVRRAQEIVEGEPVDMHLFARFRS